MAKTCCCLWLLQDVILQVLLGVARGMDWLHQQNVLHGDLKAVSSSPGGTRLTVVDTRRVWHMKVVTNCPKSTAAHQYWLGRRQQKAASCFMGGKLLCLLPVMSHQVFVVLHGALRMFLAAGTFSEVAAAAVVAFHHRPMCC